MNLILDYVVRTFGPFDFHVLMNTLFLADLSCHRLHGHTYVSSYKKTANGPYSAEIAEALYNTKGIQEIGSLGVFASTSEPRVLITPDDKFIKLLEDIELNYNKSRNLLLDVLDLPEVKNTEIGQIIV